MDRPFPEHGVQLITLKHSWVNSDESRNILLYCSPARGNRGILLLVPCLSMRSHARGYLLGEESQEVISDWSFVNDVPICQIQTSVFILPHSINLNCSSMENELFIGCMNCEGKRWGAALTERGQARIRIGGTVYPVAARRLTDTAEKDHAWLSSSIKAERPPGTPRPPDNIWWTFHLTSAN